MTLEAVKVVEAADAADAAGRDIKTLADLKAAIKRAKKVFVYVAWAQHDGDYIPATKAAVLKMLDMADYDPVMKVKAFESLGELYIG